ncbi:MAG: Crp/Fnr family transcriptional regulator [Syntrophorhabdaceae bacterium]|nr:Crp/Fnr family transcriptional regulator [Syntrophorhabdaceae bacterium]
MNRYIDCIKTVGLFSSLKDSEIESIAEIAALKSYPKGATVFQEGESGDALFIILKGKVKVSLLDEDGREYILDTLGKEGFFGELSLIDELPRSANVFTLEDSEFLIIRRANFIKLLLEKPSITIKIMQTLSKRLRSADERIKGLAFLSVENRVLKYLMEVGEKIGVKMKNYLIIENGPTQIEIANSCGCSRETVSRVIKNLVEKGMIKARKRQYAIPLTFTAV